MKGLDKKIGPLKLWQWLVIGGGTGVLVYLYERKKSSEGVNPEEEEKLLGALSRAGGGGGEGSSAGGSSLPVPGLEGPAGAPGISGPQGESPARTLEAQVENLEKQEQDLQAKQAAIEAKNKPPTQSHNGAPHALPKGYVKNSKGEAYRTVIKGNNIFHEYKNRKGPSKVVRVGAVHKAKPPAKRPKPKPVAHRVTAKKAPARKKKKAPVHR